MFQQDIPKTRGELVRVQVAPFRSLNRLDVRQFFLPDGATAPVGTRRGVNLPISDLPLLRSILQAAEADALRSGLLDEEAYEAHGLEVPAELVS